jgi:hypothetical protein
VLISNLPKDPVLYLLYAGFRVSFIASSNIQPMKAPVLVFILFSSLAIMPCSAQLCPGGGSNFLTAVSFNPAWIYGCNTGTSCNGGVAFDNRSACIPITALEACAPPPTCGAPGNSASNVWFTFFATSPTALISCFQNTSLVLGIQAFNGSALCGSLTQIGCALAGGPSSGVQLSLSGLLPGKLYYFRIFGSANPVSQRTGLYCFCGSSGLGNFNILPMIVSGLKANITGSGIGLDFTIEDTENIQSLEIEKSADGTNFSSLSTIPIVPGSHKKTFHFTDPHPANGNNYYRVKLFSADGHAAYTKLVIAATGPQNDLIILGNPVRHSLQLAVKSASTVFLVDIAGHVLKTWQLNAGNQSVSVEHLYNGVYFLKAANGGAAQKFYVAR